jgi:hypothetical protein
VSDVLNGKRGLTDELAHLMGKALGYDAPYVAVMLSRDQMVRTIAELEAEPGSDPYRLDACQEILARMNDEASWRNPYASSPSGKRLAFETLRVRAGLSREDFAAAHARRTGGDVRRILVSLGRYEHSRKAEDPAELASWLVTLGLATGEHVDMEELETLADALLQVQALGLQFASNRSFNWKDLTATGSLIARGRFVVPPGWTVQFGDMPTVHGQIDLELIHVCHHPQLDEPEARAEGPFPRLTAYGEAGIEMAIVLKGEVWLRTSRPLDPKQPPNAQEPRLLPVHESPHAAPSFVLFDARLRHDVEFRAPVSLVLAINIRGVLDPSRKLGKKTQFNAAAIRRGRRPIFDRNGNG